MNGRMHVHHQRATSDPGSPIISLKIRAAWNISLVRELCSDQNGKKNQNHRKKPNLKYNQILEINLSKKRKGFFLKKRTIETNFRN